MSNNARDLLVKLGVGQFNATMIIQYMFIPAATTDPKSPPIMELVRVIQRKLQALGYKVPHNGYLGTETAHAIARAVGPGWERMMWGDIVKGVLSAPAAPKERAIPQPRVAVGFLPDLPSVPGGMITYAAGAAAAYYFLVHKKRK